MLSRPRHRHSTDNSPHSFRVCILAPSLCFVLPMDLFLGPQRVSTCSSLRWMMSRRLLVHDFNIGRAWRCAALGTDIQQMTHLIPFAFVFLHRFFMLHYRWIYSLFRSFDDLRLSEGTVPFLFKASCQGGPVVQILVHLLSASGRE